MAPTYDKRLKPCPFCNAEAFLRTLYIGYIVDAWHDENCPMACRPLPYDTHWCTREAATAAWNNRVEGHDRH